MANNPPTVHVLKFRNSGNVEVFPLLPTQVLGSQDGSDVGTGGPGLAVIEATDADGFDSNRVAEFRDDRYCIIRNTGSNVDGVYKKAQGGAGAWGRVYTPVGSNDECSGLHVLHPDGVPTLAWFHAGTNGTLYVASSTDGTSWNAVNTGSVWASSLSPGMSIVYRDSIYFAHQNTTGGMISQYDFALSSFTRYPATVFNTASQGCSFALHVHDNTLFGVAPGSSPSVFTVAKLQAGTFSQVALTDNRYTSATTGQGHPAMFTDPTTGDLIVIVPGGSSVSSGANSRTEVWRIENATSDSPTTTDISSTVLGAVEGADKYLEGGGSATGNRRWAVYVDNDTVPGTPRVFLWTWGQAVTATTECWEWTGVGTEIEAVASLAGIVDDFALPYQSVGGGERQPGGAPRAELGDDSNAPTEVIGGTRHYFRVYGTGGPSVMTVYYSQNEDTPSNIATLTGTVTVESGSPATTPSRSGNTITNLTADDGATLYSFVHDATSDGLGEGASFTLMPDVV